MTVTSVTTSKYKAPALEKGLDILELLAAQDLGLSQKEIAVALGRNLSEVFRMIVCLEERGYIYTGPNSEKYQLSLKLFDLASRHTPVKRLTQVSREVMKTLASQIDQSCHLAILVQDKLKIIEQIDSNHPLNFSVRLGSDVDLLESSSGPCILAFCSEDKRQSLIEGYGAKYTKALSKLFDKIRTQRTYQQDSKLVVGVTNLSCPIEDYNGEVVAALTVPYISKKDANMDVEAVKQHLISACQEVSRAMGTSRVDA